MTEGQARHLLMERFRVGENAVAPILRQMKMAGLIRRLDGAIVLDGGKPDSQRLMANELLLGLYPSDLPVIRDAAAIQISGESRDKNRIRATIRGKIG